MWLRWLDQHPAGLGLSGLLDPYLTIEDIGQDYMSQPMGLEAEGNVQKKLHWDYIDMYFKNPIFYISGGGGKVCGEGQGACCAGSNEGCPSYAPVCSEWGYCQV